MLRSSACAMWYKSIRFARRGMLRERRPHARRTRARVSPAGADADACVACTGGDRTVLCPQYPPACPPWVAGGACPDQARARACREADAVACVASAGSSQAVRCAPNPPACPPWVAAGACPDQARARACREADADACVAWAGSSQAVRCAPNPPACPPWVAGGACPDQARARASREADADACVAWASNSQTMLYAPKPPAGGLAFFPACTPACTWPPPPPPALCACGVGALGDRLRRMTLEDRSACMHKRGAAGRPGGGAPTSASQVLARGLQVQDRGASRDRRGAAGGPGGEAPAPASWIRAHASRKQDQDASRDRRGAAGGPGGEAPAPASSIQVEFVPAFRQDIYDKYAQRAEASGGYAMMHEAAPKDEHEVQKYNNFVQAHELCKRVWLDRFGSQAQRLEPTPGDVIAMGRNEQGTVVVCALIQIITGHWVGTVGRPIHDTIQVALIYNLATSSSEEGRGHARKLITEIKEYAKNAGCFACALGVDTLDARKGDLEIENILEVYDGRVKTAELQKRAQQQTLRIVGLYHRADFRYQLQWRTKPRESEYSPAEDDPLFFFSNRHPRTGYIMVCWLLDGAPDDRYRLKEIDDKRLLDDVDKNYALTWDTEPEPWSEADCPWMED